MIKVLLLIIALIIAIPTSSHTRSYPRDGRFKRLCPRNDPWFYVDYEHWDVEARDKWQDVAASYVAQRLLSARMDKYLSAPLIFSLGVAKECEHAYREGGSVRDLAVNTLGIVSVICDKPTTKILCTYDQENMMLNLIVAFK
jgi:hypothetical protein